MTTEEGQSAVKAESLADTLRHRLAAAQDRAMKVVRLVSAHLADILWSGLVVALGAILADLSSVPLSDVLPEGILTLEFMGTRSNANSLQYALLADPSLRAAVIGAVTWDFLLVVWYGGVFWMLVRNVNDRFLLADSEERLVHRVACWAPIAAGGFDVLENLGILAIVQNWFLGGIGLLAAATTLAAALKWTLLLYVVAYVAVRGFVLARRTLHARAHASTPMARSHEEEAVAELRALAERYESIRRTMDPGPARTRKMEEVVADMSALAPAAAPHVDQLTEGKTPGERLAAVTILQAHLIISYIPWLVRRLSEERPFIAFHAAAALLAALPKLSQKDRQGIRERMLAIKATLEAANMHDAPRDQLIEQIISTSG